jgi:hypothetical protein
MLFPSSGIGGLSAKSACPKEGFSYARFLLYTTAPGVAVQKFSSLSLQIRQENF